MNKRQANKIVNKILLGINQQYTSRQQRKARQACGIPYIYTGYISHLKDRKPITGVVTSFNDKEMTIDYSTNPDPLKVNKSDIEDDLPPHGLVAGLTQVINLRRHDENDTDFKKRLTMSKPEGKWGMSYTPSTKWKS